ncbi:MAG: cytochrome c [Aquihabitans sp.]
MTVRSRLGPSLIMVPALVVGLLLAGCSSESSSESKGDSIMQGEATYQQSCASCHGIDLRGTDKGPSHLSQVYEPGHHPDAAFRSAIENGAQAHHWGFGDMAPVPGLDDAEIEAVIAFVRQQQELLGFEAYPPA